MKFSSGIGEHWIDSACKPGNRPALIDTLGTSLSAKKALTGSIVFSRHIAKLSPEQNIGIMLPTSAGGMLTNMACMLLGKTAVNLNFTGTPESTLSAIQQADIKIVYTSSTFLNKLKIRGIDLSILKDSCTLVMLEDLVKKTSTIKKALTLLLCKVAPATLLKKLYCSKADPKQTAVILFSSGSEGEPKGVVLSHQNILTNIMQIQRVLKFNDKDVILASLPLFHSFGLTVTQFLPLLMRVPVVCHADPIDVLATAQAIERFRITIIFGTSTLYGLYIRNTKIQPSLLNSLRLVIAGAEKLQLQVLNDFKDKFNIEIYEGYGATETSPVACVNIPEHLSNEYGDTNSTFRAGSVGLPLINTLFRIVDPQTLETLPTNEAGMILISGGQVMQGYLKNADRTSRALKVIDDRVWYVTGDKGLLDDDGFLFIQDRYSRFAKIGGEMIGLANIETAIKNAINETDLDILAVNISDSKKGERIVVLTTAELNDTVLREKLTLAGLPTLALPTNYITIAAIPTLGSGKTDYSAAKKIALSSS